MNHFTAMCRIILACTACALFASCALDGKNSSPQNLVQNFGFSLDGDNLKKEGGKTETYQSSQMPVIDAEKPQTYSGEVPTAEIDTSYESSITVDRTLVLDSATVAKNVATVDSIASDSISQENGAAVAAPFLIQDLEQTNSSSSALQP